MIKNYFKIAWRNLVKDKLYTGVNLIGLATGITACMLIGLYIRNETSYDNFHAHANRIARVYMEYSFSGTQSKVDLTGTKVGPQLKRDFEQIETYVRTMRSERSVSNGIRSFDEKHVLYADSDFFKMFSYPLLSGNSTTALDGPLKVVLTAATAKKYFGNESAIGKTLKLDGGDKAYEVTGVVNQPPANSQLQFDVLISFSSLGASKSEIWMTANYQTYLLLRRPDQIASLNPLLDKYMKNVNRTEMEIPADSKNYMTLQLEPLTSIHLHSAVSNSFEANGNITYIYVLAIVGLLILLIACANYTNLATAKSMNRGTEIGVRKVMGAGKFQLIRQFLGESSTVTFLALLLAYVAGILLLPVFNTITGKVFLATQFFQPGFVLVSICAAIVISILSGAYPALILSNARIIGILKSGVKITGSGSGLRQTLITAQFAIAIFLMVCTLVVNQQISYVYTKKMGYDREQVVVLPVDRKVKPVYEQLKAAFRNTPGVESVTGAYETPTSVGWGDGLEADNGKEKKQLSIAAVPADLDYLQTLGMKLAAGRDFSKSDFALQDTTNGYANYRTPFLLNEKAAKELGWTPEEAVGKIVSRVHPGPVTGVVKDFHFYSLHESIGPLVIFLDTTLVRELYIKVKSKDMPSTLAALEQTWKTKVTHRSFDYRFLDDDFNSLYLTEQRTARLFSLFSGISIVLACLGLFALTAFVTAQRTREIGIRKVLGASVFSIVGLLSGGFVKLVILALVISAPVAIWTMNKWLTGFAYRIDIAWWIPVLAGITALVIALFTISFQAIRTATANPVKSLRNE